MARSRRSPGPRSPGSCGSRSTPRRPVGVPSLAVARTPSRVCHSSVRPSWATGGPAVRPGCPVVRRDDEPPGQLDRGLRGPGRGGSGGLASSGPIPTNRPTSISSPTRTAATVWMALSSPNRRSRLTAVRLTRAKATALAARRWGWKNWSIIILAVAAVAEGLRASPRHRERGRAAPVRAAVNTFLTIWVRD